MSAPIKFSIITIALIAAASSCAQAAGGIKGQQRLVAAGSIKSPAALRPPPQQAQYLPPPPPAPPAAIKAGLGQAAPTFSAARVQPIVQQQQQEQQQIQIQQVPQFQPQQQEQEPAAQQQQVEIDPSAAAQDNAPAIAVPARAAASEEEANPRPEPYNFQYAFESGDQATSGSSQREEQQDASGRVTGFYTLLGEDGRNRRVDYVADASGFRATISTNELGTAPKDSADVDWNAQNPSDAQLRAAESATQAARQRALLNPQAAASGLSSSSSLSGSQSKFSAPRTRPAGAQPQYNGQTAASQQLSKTTLQQQDNFAQQLQEPFEQIRQTELNARARKSRHAPFYLYTV